ncbi:MAG: response regulator [Anaerolineae bacterium]
MTQHILVVDDEAGIRHLLRSVLVEEQYEVSTAGTTLDALDRLKESSFDLAIVDLMLPDVDGLQLAEAIRMLDPQTPVILITAYGSPSLELMAAHPAIFHYLHKPFSLDHLLYLVSHCLPSSS